MNVSWKEHSVLATSYELRPAGSGWVPQARIVFQQGARSTHKDLLAPEGVLKPTKAEADSYALDMAVAWLDKNGPLAT